MTKGQRIRTLRENMDIGLTELAEMIDVSKQTLYKYENDIVTNIPSDKIEALADALRSTPGYIMGWDDLAYDPALVARAMKMYQQYQDSIPAIQDAVDGLLKPRRPDPGSAQKKLHTAGQNDQDP